jgi:hypothetical protein
MVESDRKKKILSEIHKGLPNAKVEFEEVLNVSADEVMKEAPTAKLRVSLDGVRVNIHNQSYGMISASTGCISNPGGPSC